jgi:DNA mismatch endonuclease (patch repair protein)
VKPDFVFRRERLVVFVDGCFWHGCPLHYTRPKTRREFWEAKIAGNRARDRRIDRALRTAGSPRSSRYRAAVRRWANGVRARGLL